MCLSNYKITSRSFLFSFLLLSWPLHSIASDQMTSPEISPQKQRYLSGLYVSEMILQYKGSNFEDGEVGQLQDVITVIKDNPDYVVELFCYHAKSRAEASKKKIASVADYLDANGVDIHQIGCSPLISQSHSEFKLEFRLLPRKILSHME